MGTGTNRSRRGWWIAAATVVVGAATGVWLALEEEPSPPAPVEVERALPTPPPPAETLPPREATDARLRELLGPLSPLAAWRQWLKMDDLLTRLVGTTDNLAEGETPRSHLDFLKPAGPFEVEDRHHRLTIAERTTARYDGFASVVGSLDAKACASTYQALRPLLRTAYHLFGYPDREFDEVARRALDRLVATPAPTQVELVSVHGALYRFADPKLEALSPAEKQLLRMGPRNEKLIQDKAAELRTRLGEPAK